MQINILDLSNLVYINGQKYEGGRREEKGGEGEEGERFFPLPRRSDGAAGERRCCCCCRRCCCCRLQRLIDGQPEEECEKKKHPTSGVVDPSEISKCQVGF